MNSSTILKTSIFRFFYNQQNIGKKTKQKNNPTHPQIAESYSVPLTVDFLERLSTVWVLVTAESQGFVIFPAGARGLILL